MKQNSFFKIYAHEYDILTNAVERKKYHRQEIKALVDYYKPGKVMDAGCATGLSAHLFAENNIETIGIDRSRPMIKIASEKYDLPNLKFKYGNFEKLPQSLHNKFDLVVCLANSISGVGSMNNLLKSLYNFHKVLKFGGHLVIQMLNYVSLHDGEILPVRATNKGGVYYQRFSERKGKKLFIYVNRLDTAKEPLHYEMFRHEFENFSVNEMTAALKKTGYSQISKYADLSLSKKFTKTCRDLVLTAQKNSPS